MDQLVRDFRKAERECKSPSASAILARLALLNRQSFRICQIPLSSGDGADNPATTFYSVTIGISTPEDEKKAVESGIGREPVTEKASKPIYEYLVREAEDRLGPRPAVAPPSPPPPTPAPVTILTPPPTPPSPNPPPPPPKPEKKSNGDGNSSSSYIPYYVVLNEQYLEKMAKLADDLNGLKIVPDNSNSNNKVVDSNNHGLEKGAESQNPDSAEPEMDQNDDEQLVPDMPPLEDDFDSVMADDPRMMTMFDSLVLKGYRLFKNCETVVDARRGTPLYKATVRIPEFGEFCICSRDKMRDAIRGAALKLKFYLQSEGIADYDLRPGAIQPYQQREFPLPEGESEAKAKADRKPDPNAPFVISLAVPIRPIDQKVDVAPVEAEQVELDPMKVPNTTEKEENDEEELSYHQLLTNQIASIKEVSGLAATNQNVELPELANQIQGGGDEPMANQNATANYVEKVEVKDFSNLNDFFLHGPLTPASQVPPPRSSTSFRPANGHSLDDEFYMKLLGDYHKSETTKSTSTKQTSTTPISTKATSTKATSTTPTLTKQNFELPDLSSILTEANKKKEDSTVKSEGKSEQQPPVIVASIRTPESAAVVQELMSRSNKEPDEENIKLRVELIKNFNSAYALSKSALDIMTDLNRITDDNKKKHFSVMTEPMPVPLKDHLVSYVSTVKLTDVAAFSGIGETEQSSRDEAVRQAFAWIKGLSTMLTKFKTLFMITHCPLTIVGELIPNYRGNISMKNKVVPEKGNLIQTTVQLINMGLFYDYGPTEIEAKQKCFSRVMSYLNKLATGIFGEPRGFNPLRNSGLASTERMQESASYQEFCKDPRTRLLNAHTGQVDRAVSPPSASIHNSSFLKRAQLFKNFNQVYDPKKTSVEILNDLNALYPRHQMPPICIQAAYDPITSIYRATARIDSLASLTSTELTESEAKRKAQLKAFHFLKDITSLISHFWKFRLAAFDPNTNQHERSALEMLEDMMRRNAYLIKMSTIKERQSKYRTIIQIVNINSFVGNGSTELESKEAAAINAVDYFEDFAKKIF